MLIAAIAYLYVMCTLAVVYMANGRLFIGAIVMLFGGIMPVVLWLWMVNRNRRARLLHYQEEIARKAQRQDSAASQSDHGE